MKDSVNNVVITTYMEEVKFLYDSETGVPNFKKMLLGSLMLKYITFVIEETSYYIFNGK